MTPRRSSHIDRPGKSAIRFRCFRCKTLLRTSSYRIGSIVICGKCGAGLRVPHVNLLSPTTVQTLDISETSTAPVKTETPACATHPALHRLRSLILKHGPGICREIRRCESFIRDFCADKILDAHLLVYALKQRVPEDLLEARQEALTSTLFLRLATRLEARLGLTSPFARWAVITWANAIGIEGVTEASFGGQETDGKNATPERLGPPPIASFKTLRHQHVVRNGEMGILLHVELKVLNMAYEIAHLSAFFYNAQGIPLVDTDRQCRSSEGKVAFGASIIPLGAEMAWENFELFCPYAQLHLPKGHHALKLDLVLFKSGTTPWLPLGILRAQPVEVTIEVSDTPSSQS